MTLIDRSRWECVRLGVVLASSSSWPVGPLVAAATWGGDSGCTQSASVWTLCQSCLVQSADKRSNAVKSFEGGVLPHTADDRLVLD